MQPALRLRANFSDLLFQLSHSLEMPEKQLERQTERNVKRNPGWIEIPIQT
jgi:hypothetical protein